MEEINIGFSAPGSVWTEVDDPTDEDEVIRAFIHELNQKSEEELLNLIETDPVGLVENLHYVDGSEGEVYHEW